MRGRLDGFNPNSFSQTTHHRITDEQSNVIQIHNTHLETQYDSARKP